MLKSFIFIVTFLACCFLSDSQSIDRYVISNGGGFGRDSSFSLSYTIGEESINTWSLTNYFISEGFQQGALYSPSVPVFNITISPIPVTSRLEVSFSLDSTTFLSAQIFNLTGVMLENINFGQVERGDVKNIDFGSFLNGIYLLRIETLQGKTLKTFKVLKI